jgi:MarR family transcriptional regulator for hemolysin
MTPAAKSAEYEYTFLLHEVAHLMRTLFNQRARTRGMTRAQWVILKRLDRTPGLSQNELAAIVEVEPITIGRLIDRLEARGVVERRADPKDRRIHRLHLTPKAKPILQEINDTIAELGSLTAAGIDEKTLKTVMAALSAMKANLNCAASPAKKSAG